MRGGKTTWWKAALTCAAMLSALTVSTATVAEPDAEAKRLMKLRDSVRYEVLTKHSSTKAGCARVHVAAPEKVVFKVAEDFRHYEDFIKKFDKSKVVGRNGDETDVYLQVPILKGAAKIWAVVRFSPMKKVGNEHILQGSMVKGNVKRMDAKWRIKKIDDDNTQLHLELLIVPKLPVPGSVVTGEVAYAADVAVIGSRDRAERKHKADKAKKKKKK
jgi:ribosome-associated toxin RatA of RatAB toxin-antitoxin module